MRASTLCFFMTLGFFMLAGLMSEVGWNQIGSAALICGIVTVLTAIGCKANEFDG